MNPLISIIVPIYNTDFRLRACIDSILAQDYRPIEIILVNDGSTDGSAAICSEYSQKFPQIIKFIDGPNGGSSVARNRGLEAAAGEWVWFCDSDDVFEPDFCSYLLNYAQHANAQIACCALICDDSAQPDIRMNVKVTGEEVFDRDAVLHRWIWPLLRVVPETTATHGQVSIALLRRDVIEEHNLRFIPGLSICEDEAFCLNYLMYVERAAMSDRVLYHYLSTNNSACKRFFHHRKATPSYRRVTCWSMLWQNRLSVFLKLDLKRDFPTAGAVLMPTACYHRMRWVCDNPETGTAEKLRTVKKELAAFRALPDFQTWADTAAPLKLRIFMLCVKMGALPVMLFCRGVKLLYNEKR